MTSALVLLFLYSLPTDAPAAPPADLLSTWPNSGWSLEYGPRVMEHSAAAWHVGWYAGIQGYTSVPDCRHVGDLVRARVAGHVGLWRVADCTKKRDLPALRNWHHLDVAIVMEVWNQTARAQGWDWYLLGGPGHAKAEVLAFIPTRYHPGRAH